MPRRALVALVAVLIGVASTAIIVARLVPAADEEPSVLSEPTPGVGAVPLMEPGDSDGALQLAVRPFPAVSNARVGVRVATYLEPPTATLRLTARSADARTLADCTVPPDRYADNGLVLCPVRETAAVRFVRLEARGDLGASPVAVFARQERDRLVGGTLFAASYPSSLPDRVAIALDRATVGRSFPGARLILLLGSVGAVALLIPVLLAGVRAASPDRADGRRR